MLWGSLRHASQIARVDASFSLSLLARWREPDGLKIVVADRQRVGMVGRPIELRVVYRGYGNTEVFLTEVVKGLFNERSGTVDLNNLTVVFHEAARKLVVFNVQNRYALAL
jgi:hypothetical protein